MSSPDTFVMYIRNTEGPVIILFIAIIVILLYNYIDDYVEVNNRLRDIINQQQVIITKKTNENRQLAELVSYMYYKQTGEELSPNWTMIPKEDNNPVH